MDVASEISLLDSIGIHIYDIISVSVSVDFDLSVSLAQSLILPSVQIEFVDTSVLPRDYDGCSCGRSIDFRILKTELARVSRCLPILHDPGTVFFFSVGATEEIVERVSLFFVSDTNNVQIVSMATIENLVAERLNVLE
jgi:hypothetical protein